MPGVPCSAESLLLTLAPSPCHFSVRFFMWTLIAVPTRPAQGRLTLGAARAILTVHAATPGYILPRPGPPPRQFSARPHGRGGALTRSTRLSSGCACARWPRLPLEQVASCAASGG